SVIAVLHILTQQHNQLDSVGEIVGPGDPSSRITVQQRGAIVSFPVGAHTVAAYHYHGCAFYRDAIPDMDAVPVQGNRDRADLGPQFGEASRRGFDQCIYILLRKTGPAKSFGH